jgi:hypothetical protein
VRSTVRIVAEMTAQIETLARELEASFVGHPDAEILRSLPGLGSVLGARVLAEFGDDPARYADPKARKNYAGTSPITKASGRSRSPWPGSLATGDSPMRSRRGRSALSPAHPVPGATTTRTWRRVTLTGGRCDRSRTGGSASFTGVWDIASSTPRSGHGPTSGTSPLDT